MIISVISICFVHVIYLFNFKLFLSTLNTFALKYEVQSGSYLISHISFAFFCIHLNDMYTRTSNLILPQIIFLRTWTNQRNVQHAQRNTWWRWQNLQVSLATCDLRLWFSSLPSPSHFHFSFCFLFLFYKISQLESISFSFSFIHSLTPIYL